MAIIHDDAVLLRLQDGRLGSLDHPLISAIEVTSG